MYDSKATAERFLKSCSKVNDHGIRLYMPDLAGWYGALWTRDFSYMVENAFDLVGADDVEKCIDFIISAADTDGWIPDRTTLEGKGIYTAGDENFPADRNLDNGAFLVILAEEFLKRCPDSEKHFAKWEKALRKGIDLIPTDADGLVWNDPEHPHSPYGFTDCVCKTGSLCMESLIEWRALKILAERIGHAGGDASLYRKLICGTERALYKTFVDEDSGMLLAATGLCRQIDIWASCYALSIGFPLEEDAKNRIRGWLLAHLDTIAESGQVRHLPKGETWEKLFEEVAPGEYQNGACWSTAAGWLIDALYPVSPEIARKLYTDMTDYFEKYGIFECVNGEYRKMDGFVAGTVTAYGIHKKYGF